MENLNDFINQERKRRELENPQPVQQQANVKNSLLALKNMVDGHIPVGNNPLVESIKKVEKVVEHNDNGGFIKPNVSAPSSSVAPAVKPMVYEDYEKPLPNYTAGYGSSNVDPREKQAMMDLMLKTRKNLLGQEIPKEFGFNESVQHPPKVEQDFTQFYRSMPKQNAGVGIDKDDVIKTLKDTILELYVKERVEDIIKEYLQTDEGKMLLKSIVVGLFKKK